MKTSLYSTCLKIFSCPKSIYNDNFIHFDQGSFLLSAYKYFKMLLLWVKPIPFVVRFIGLNQLEDLANYFVFSENNKDRQYHNRILKVLGFVLF